MLRGSALNVNVLFGCLAVFASAFGFYLSTVVIKRAGMAGLDIPASFFVFSRFFLGFFIVTAQMVIRRQGLRIRKKRWLIGRACFNMAAVYSFYQCVNLTSVAQANILNMTYPLFIAVFSWFFLKAQRDAVTILIVLAALSGVWLILTPKGVNFNLNSLWALASGISAAVAIMYLNLSRQVHDTQTTLFFMFGIGSIVIFLLFFKSIHIPAAGEFKYLFWCSALAISGQYLLTIGFKYVTATEGGVISSTRILIAAILGPVIAMDPDLSLTGWVGACLIFAANVYLTVRKVTK